MINESMQKAINEQINKELYSAYLYLSMSAFFETRNLPGFAHWMKLQAGEELQHGMKFFEYLNERGGKVELTAIAAVPTEWKGNLEVFKQVQEHETLVTASIHSLYELALKEKDYPSQVMLQWFINEQVEEEKNAADIVQHLEMIDARGSGVLMLDHELGKRGKE